MPKKMMDMMPHGLRMILSHVAQDQRKAFTLQRVATLMEQSCGDMSEEEKQNFVAQVIETVHVVETV